jgi:hypothetical protein
VKVPGPPPQNRDRAPRDHNSPAASGRRRPPCAGRAHHPRAGLAQGLRHAVPQRQPGPATVFEQGFYPEDVIDGQYDVEPYVLVNQPSPYVSTTYDHDLYKTWYKSGFNHYIDAPGGVDVNKTIGDTHKGADQVEVAFPGGIARQYIIGVCPVDKKTKTEIMSDCENNSYYESWH